MVKLFLEITDEVSLKTKHINENVRQSQWKHLKTMNSLTFAENRTKILGKKFKREILLGLTILGLGLTVIGVSIGEVSLIAIASQAAAHGTSCKLQTWCYQVLLPLSKFFVLLPSLSTVQIKDEGGCWAVINRLVGLIWRLSCHVSWQ